MCTYVKGSRPACSSARGILHFAGIDRIAAVMHAHFVFPNAVFPGATQLRYLGAKKKLDLEIAHGVEGRTTNGLLMDGWHHRSFSFLFFTSAMKWCMQIGRQAWQGHGFALCSCIVFDCTPIADRDLHLQWTGSEKATTDRAQLRTYVHFHSLEGRAV